MASKNAKKGIGLLPLLLFIAAGAILLGLILYLLMKGKAPEAKATADASKGMLGGLLPPIQ